MPAISVIIPVYNVEKYLRRCLDSVLNQTFTDWQAVCVNDGSPDNSDKILAEYAARDKRFIIVDKKNGGLSDARNLGMKHATGEYIMYLDSDDAIHPQAMEILIDTARKTNVGMVAFKFDQDLYDKISDAGADISRIDTLVRSWMAVRYNTNKIRARVVRDAFWHATEHNPTKWKMPSKYKIRNCQVWKNMYRRDLIADIAFIRGILLEDFPWLLTVLSRRPRAAIIPIPLYLYVPTPGSILNGGARTKKMFDSLAVGINHVYDIYHNNLTKRGYKYLCYNFLWPFIVRMVRVGGGLTDAPDITDMRHVLIQMRNRGIFDNPIGSNAHRYANKIQQILSSEK